MKVEFLGTGTSQGVPVIACDCAVCHSSDERDKRLRTSVLISVDERNIVIDTGPDFRQQMLKAQVKSLDAVLFTHEHKDHISGMDDIRAFNFRQRSAMDVFATLRVQEALRREYHYCFAEEKYPGIPEITLHDIKLHPFVAAGITILPIEVQHYKMPVLGFRVGGFTYITDASSISDREKEKAMNSEVLVLNALRQQKHISHFNLEEAIELATELNAHRTYFTHISHLMGLHNEVSRQLPDNIFLAYDGMIVEV